jgi:RimJ/RimL family protein N-acetyltransferase
MRICGYTRAVLWVLSTNAGARRFYERAGWRANGIEDTYEINGVRYPTMRYATEL